MKKQFSLEEVIRIFGISKYTICRIEAEGFIQVRREQDGCRTFSADDLERIRLIVELSRDLGVNWAGVEVILHMRERMMDMQRQLDEIFRDLGRRMEQNQREQPAADRKRPSRKMNIIEVLDEREPE
jgi:MerR family transcriptional regulator, heat shock protein HspR